MNENTLRMHLSLNVRDLGRSVDFYAAFLGKDPVKQRIDYAKFELEDPGLVLTLNAAREVTPGGALSHLGLRVESQAELERAHDRIRAAAIPIELEEAGVTCCYALQDKFWVSDPDGNAWEVYRFLEDAGGPGGETAPATATGGPARSGCC